MNFSSNQLNWIAIIGAIPASIAFQITDIPLGWFIYTLIFFTFMEASPKEAFIRGCIIGAVAAFINFFWVFNGAERYTGKGLLLGIIIVIILTLFISLYIGSIAWIYTKIKWGRKIPYDSVLNIINGFIICSIFILLDAFMIYVLDSFSLLLFVSYIPVANNLYAIQHASYGGPLIITFFVIMFNALIAHILYYRAWRLWYLPVSLIVTILSSGYFLHSRFENSVKNDDERKFKAAIISENTPAEFKWDEQNGNILVNRMLALNAQVAVSDANIAVWSETAIPWNFSTNDDFLTEIDRGTSKSNITHLIGINTDYKDRTFFNSVYCIAPHKKILGRYDKRIALSLVEKPFLGIAMPFYSSHSFYVKEGSSSTPIMTPYGKAGILLCNESTVPMPAYQSVVQNAEFLVNPGNDGWFSGSYIAKQHFYHARMRAVETRKDIIINNNSGYCGLVNASGTLQKMEQNSEPSISYVDVRPNDIVTLAVRFPYLLPYISAFFLLSVIVINQFFNKNH